MSDQEEQKAESTGSAEQSAVPEEKQGSISSTPTSQSSEQETPIEQIRQFKIHIEALEKELATEREKATDYMDRAMRAQADLSNMRRRLQQDMGLAVKEAFKSIIYEQLAVLDSFDRAFAALPQEFRHFTWVEGVGLIQSQLLGILNQAGVTPIEVEKGKKYDPHEHEPVAYEDTTQYPEDAVTAELQRGYKFQGQVLRPALVKIARPPQTVAAGTETEKTEA